MFESDEAKFPSKFTELSYEILSLKTEIQKTGI